MVQTIKLMMSNSVFAPTRKRTGEGRSQESEGANSRSPVQESEERIDDKILKIDFLTFVY